jgi:peptidoglycan/xylan/chitin deacetylase (PgdA/CDA1 family)
MWTVIGQDWHWDAQRISRLLQRRASNGGIFCLHDGREVQTAPDIRPTMDALKDVLPRLKDRGFEFQTASELLCHPN